MGDSSTDLDRCSRRAVTPPPPQRRREIIQRECDRPSGTRPIRTEAVAVLTDALRDAHHRLDELTTSPNQTTESLAARSETERWISLTISLAFLCPAVVKAAVRDLIATSSKHSSEERLAPRVGRRRVVGEEPNWRRRLISAFAGL
jgi:hypothetical protein